ncbi:hypothetical protein HW126_15040 [Salinispora sp. H7-4]|nr:hypothetical protein [Salinispora sp. H7-4]
MSLEFILGVEAAAAIIKEWPERPYTLKLPPASPIGRMVNAQTIRNLLDTGCAPSDYVNIYYQGEGLHPSRFTLDDRVMPASAQLLLERGCTIQLRELNRWHPAMSALCVGIQAETGCSGYVTAFITPPGAQGLDYHWDQYLGIVVQLEGIKTWELFEPKVPAPWRDHSMSTSLWDDGWTKQWQEAGPDLAVELAARDVLVLPRGWVHNPHSRDSQETSVHLTFVVKELTPQWIAERLIGSALNDPRFRAVIPPSELELVVLPKTLAGVRGLLIEHLREMNLGKVASAVRHAMEVETSHNKL